MGSDYGYFAGTEPGPKSTIDRLDFSSDSPTMSQRSFTSTPARARMGGVSSQSYGYFGGGTPGYR